MAGETQLSSLSVDQVAFDRLAYFALRSELLFDQAEHSPSSATLQQQRQR